MYNTVVYFIIILSRFKYLKLVQNIFHKCHKNIEIINYIKINYIEIKTGNSMQPSIDIFGSFPNTDTIMTIVSHRTVNEISKCFLCNRCSNVFMN